jgi:hypothetical protein
LKKPADMSKADFGALLLKLSKKAFRTCSRGSRNALSKVAVADEKHASNGEIHKHFTLLAEKPFRPTHLQSLLRKAGIAVDFSLHDYYWSSFVYITVPGNGPGKKTKEDLDPDPWLSDRHPSIEDELCNIPPGANRSDKLRVRKFLGLDPKGRPVGVMQKDLGFEEFSTVVVERGLDTRRKLLAFIQKSKGAEGDDKATAEQLNGFIHKHVRDLDDRLALAWELHRSIPEEERAALSAWDTVRLAAERLPCICEGQWAQMTEEMLATQVEAGQRCNVDAEELPHAGEVRLAICRALQRGGEKFTNLFFLWPPNAAKTHVVAPLVTIFGKDSFRRPIGKSNFPMMNIHEKKVCVLEDLRIGTFGLSFDAYLVWWEGLPLPVPMPQNQCKGPKDYTDAAPIFATGGEKLRIPLREALELGLDPVRQNDMMDATWRYFQFSHAYTKETRVLVKPCGQCFARWLCQSVGAEEVDAEEDCVVVDFF